MNVVVYGLPFCPQCRATERVLDRAGIEYEYVDLASDIEAKQKVEAWGFKAAPVVDVGVDRWSGFRPGKLNALVLVA